MSAAANPVANIPGRLIPEARAAVAARGRGWTAGFGPRFFVLLLLGLVFLAPAWWQPSFVYGMFAWDAFVLLIWVWDFSRLPRADGIQIARVWNSPAAFGTESNVTVELRNRSNRALRARIVDDVPPTLRQTPPEVAIAAPRAAALGTDGGIGEGIGRAEYAIFPRERGDAHFGRAYIRYESVLRIAERWATADLAQSVRVYPNFEESRRAMLYLIRSRQTQLERRLRRRRGLGREFESLREFRPGDEYRDVCWTATARRAHLVTKIYQVERSQTVWIVLDTGRLLRARVNGPSKLDYAVNATLSLAQVAMYSGDNVGLMAYGRKIQQQLEPARGAAQIRAMVEALALTHVETAEANHLRAAGHLLSLQKRRSLIVWLTDLAETPATPEVIEGAMQIANRHVVLFGVISQPELREVGREVPKNVAQMYEHAAAVEMIQRRELLLRRMRQQGVLALELAPSGLSTALVNQYLDTKERGLL
ncbi:MAG TPA: DUF58 domain-containing protein [Candidatus Acidoferrales bacterium]|nr:DUF58 domain-containing protein [Candidatus Acidoferrales bacterium]